MIDPMMMKINHKSSLGTKDNHLRRERPQILKCNLRIKTLRYLQVRRQRKLKKRLNPSQNVEGSGPVLDVVPKSDKMQTRIIQIHQWASEELRRR